MKEGRRNESFADLWSITHVAWAAGLAWAWDPFWALVVMVLWEPVEILVLSPLLARRGVSFGHEGLRNTLMDLVFDVAGVLVGAFVLRPLLPLPWS